MLELDETAFNRLMEKIDIDAVTAFAEECRVAFALNSAQGSSNSKLQREVAAAVRYVLAEDQHGVEVLEEQVLEQEGGSYSVDIQLVGWPGLPKLAIEVDGPSHFLGAKELENRLPAIGSELQFDGTSKFKHRLLSRLGWTVLHVPFFQWGRLGSREAKAAYIRELLGGNRG